MRLERMEFESRRLRHTLTNVVTIACAVHYHFYVAAKLKNGKPLNILVVVGIAGLFAFGL